MPRIHAPLAWYQNTPLSLDEHEKLRTAANLCCTETLLIYGTLRVNQRTHKIAFIRAWDMPSSRSTGTASGMPWKIVSCGLREST